MKAGKAKKRAKAKARPKDLAITPKAGARSARMKGGGGDARTRRSLVTTLSLDL
jgi:hypothetical protein